MLKLNLAFRERKGGNAWRKEQTPCFPKDIAQCCLPPCRTPITKNFVCNYCSWLILLLLNKKETIHAIIHTKLPQTRTAMSDARLVCKTLTTSFVSSATMPVLSSLFVCTVAPRIDSA